MPTNPFDNDRTDELPILVETVVLGANEAASPDGDLLEDTAERAANQVGLPAGTTADVESLQTDLAARGARIAALEEDIARLSTRWNEVERHLNARDTRIEELNRMLAELRHALAERHIAEKHLARQLAEHSAEVERLNTENAELRAAVETAQANLNALEARPATPPPAPADVGSLQPLREEIASLSAYIANRSHWWNEIKALAAASAERIGTLQRELQVLTAARRDAAALATKESARAAQLRADLVAATHLLEEQRRELAATRGASIPSALAEAAPAPIAPASRTPLEPAAAAEPAAPTLANIEQEIAAAPGGPAEAAGDVLPAPAFEVLAALEAEVAHKRQQIAAQLVELREREQRLTAGSATIERLRQDLATLRAELEQKSADVGRLERAVVDKDRALAARDVRVATLQEELNQRLGAVQKLNAMDLSLQGLNTKMSDRLRRAEPAAESTRGPTLMCLTGDAPRQVVLTKKTITIGRGHHCDIQILTHFVSREHARITTEHGTTVIEDLASTNGVFVNSIRVDRHELHHGDLLTIGETQFRFLESVAH